MLLVTIYLHQRLLLNRSASLELERLMVAKLHKECGAAFTSKLEGMFKVLSADKNLSCSFLNLQFQMVCYLLMILKFSAFVLVAGHGHQQRVQSELSNFSHQQIFVFVVIIISLRPRFLRCTSADSGSLAPVSRPNRCVVDSGRCHSSSRGMQLLVKIFRIHALL